ncbi:hypothetical protein WJ56_15390 [Burkholderia ubonensis]|nr:hypothetical protein WJ51_19160 [Burkholderia ubonensis]KVM12927.1 hypothetical protein WJ52_18815 [Burkholderia ubonensis]KVM49956.1 hypothetical protein WJ56_15390 [Burkholderia ubonensis]
MISTTLHDARGDRQIAEAHLPGRRDDVTRVREAAAVDRDAVRVRQNHVRAWTEDPRTLRLSWIIDGFVLVTWLTIVRALMPMLFRSAPAFETLNDVRNAADGGRDIDGLATA